MLSVKLVPLKPNDYATSIPSRAVSVNYGLNMHINTKMIELPGLKCNPIKTGGQSKLIFYF